MSRLTCQISYTALLQRLLLLPLPLQRLLLLPLPLLRLLLLPLPLLRLLLLPLPLLRLLLMLLLLLPAPLQAQRTDFSGLRIFINPGHGGHDGDDRHMTETDFWESEGNLAKGLFLRDLLQARNATVYMSRTTNNTSDDLPLSTIAAMANSAGADLFLSIHSNGFDGTRNQPLTLFRGYDNAPVYPQAKNFAHMLWQKLFEKGNCWTHTFEWVKGDWTFYPDWGDKVGLGVLRTLTLPGVLSEGSFHDYIPEGWRLRNDDHLHHEAWAMLRAMQEYFNVTPDSYGIIAGVVRDRHATPPWYFGPGTNDRHMPLNGATVKVMPLDRTITLDNLNNGFFMFDSVPPGTWKLIAGGLEGFFNDTLTVEVTAGRSTLANILLPFDTTRVPEVAGLLPDLADSIAFNQPLTYTFNIPMDRQSVEQALAIVPAAGLTFGWDDKGKILTITPQTGFASATEYTVTIGTGAASLWGVPLSGQHEVTFVTRARTRLVAELVWPHDGAGEVTLYPRVTLKFDAPLDQAATAAGTVVTDSRSVPLAKARERFATADGKGIYTFELTEPLTPGSEYHLTIGDGVKDLTGTPLGETITAGFTTRTDAYLSGNVVESFNNIAVFWDPEASGSTTGTDNPLTTFTASYDTYRSEPPSGRLDYLFTGSAGGLCRVFNTRKPPVGSNTSQLFTIWVYGDLSNNELEYWFYSPGTVNQIVSAATIDWAGWDQVTIPLSSVGGVGEKQFHSVVIRQKAGASRQGVIWFDDAMVVTPSAIETPADDGVALTLFPNPLIGEGTMSFLMPLPGEVMITLWSTTGRLMATLFEGAVEAGRQQLPFLRPAGLAPGIYLLRMGRRTGGTVRYTYGRWVVVR